MMLLLLGVVWMMVLMLKFRQLHLKSSMALTTIHQHMLSLVCLIVHAESGRRLCEWRGSRRRRGVFGKLYASVRRSVPVSREMSLMGVKVLLIVELPGSRLLEPEGCICHLTRQRTRDDFSRQTNTFGFRDQR